MVRIGYHASHEEFSPRDLLRWARLAEEAGFETGMSSDHFHPWSPEQGQSGFAWSWLGAALATTTVDWGVISVPGWRYHPAILAQAGATLSAMFPGRFWMALGSGQALNEHIIGTAWPPKSERNERLREAAGIIRALWAGETVTHRGQLRVDEATLYTRPERPPLLFGAAVTDATARLIGAWADGLLTVQGTGPDAVRPVVNAFREGGGTGRPLYLQAALCWAPSESEALEVAHSQWRFNALGGDANWDLRTPEEFATASRFVRPEDMRQAVLISSDLGQHADWLAGYAELGFEVINLHLLGPDQERLIELFGAKVLPQLTR